MANYFTQTIGIATALLALTITASAEIKLNDNFSTSGYVVGSYRYTNQAILDGEGTYKADSFDVDSAKLLFGINYKPVSAVVSLYYDRLPSAFIPTGINIPSVSTVLDAYVTYDMGNGYSISGGKFLSWLGFESFDAPGMYQMSYANGDFLAIIPGYHSGLRFEFAGKDYGYGIALVDSIYNDTSSKVGEISSVIGRYSKGDSELRYNQGVESYVKYTGVQDLTLFAGLAYESKRTNETSHYVHEENVPSIVTLDFWASYQATKELLFAAEFAHKNGDADSDLGRGYNWLLLTNYVINDKLSTAFRISGEHLEGYRANSYSAYRHLPNFVKVTVGPSYEVTKNLIIRGDVSYYNYANYTYDDKDSYATRALNHATYVGVQALFKF